MSAQQPTQATAPPTRDVTIKHILTDHPLVSFFALAYALTWVVWIPVLLSRLGLAILPFDILVPAPLFLLVSTILGPTLSAFLLTGVTSGKAGVQQLLRRIVRWRVGVQWYLLALFGLPVAFVLGASVWRGAAPLQAVLHHSSVLASYLLLVTFGLVITVFEEIGWMGFAFPRLQAAVGPVAGSAILGALWAVWHLPSFFVASSGGARYTGVNIPVIALGLGLLIVTATLIRVIMAWLYNNTQGALPISMLFHSAADQTIGLFSVMIGIAGFTDPGGNHRRDCHLFGVRGAAPRLDARLALVPAGVRNADPPGRTGARPDRVGTALPSLAGVLRTERPL